nr:MBL fold metallo-hydrolase [Acidipropionibacterium jensenii]
MESTSSHHTDDVVWTPLTASIWTTRLDPYGVTCGLVIGVDHLLLVDTGSTPSQGAALSMAAARAMGRPVDRVVVTHDHGDHCGGLGAVRRAAGPEGIEVWMHRAAVARMARDLGGSVEHPMSMLAYLDLGGLSAEVVHPGAGHTDGDLVVRVPDEQVTFLGDLVETSGDPQADESTDFWNWPSAISSAVSAANGEGLFVPGHGDPADALTVMNQAGGIGRAVDQVRTAMESGVPADRIQEGHDWPFREETIADWVPRIVDQLAARGITRRNLLPLTKR